MLPTLRYARLWGAVSVLVVIAALYVNLMPARELPQLGNDKGEHIVGYLLLAVWFGGLYPRSRYPWIAVALVLMGLFIEWAQGAMHLGRERDYRDVVANCAGIAAGLVLAWIGLDRWAHWLESWRREP